MGGDAALTKLQESHLSIHAPSTFLAEYWQQLLPHWNCPVRSVLIYLQSSSVKLCERTPQTEIVKQALRDSFLHKAQKWHQSVIEQGYLAEPFDPKFGTPLYSAPGEWLLDDVAVAHALLHIPMAKQGGCTLLKHPQWHTGVFPATLLSSASPCILRNIVMQSVAQPTPPRFEDDTN